VTERGYCGSYGNYLTQWLSIIRVMKKAVVQNVETRFILRLFLKLAASSFCQTLRIQYKKNNTTGSKINKYRKNWFN
jgi:hypothetical protein